MPIEIAHSHLLLLASIAIAITASFTALRMTSNLRTMTIVRRKKRVAQGAFALGGGIWSMHFVGMLSMEMPASITYAPLPTLASALIAILVTGTALMTLHFGLRNRTRIAFAGVLTGMGIVAMHYLGMSAISANYILVYNPIGLVIAVTIGIGASVGAMALAYGQRSLGTTIAGAIALGLAISAMHYSAMYFTAFSFNSDLTIVPVPMLSSDTLALIVAIFSFVICGLFLLSTVPAELEPAELEPADGDPENREALAAAKSQMAGGENPTPLNSENEEKAAQSTSSLVLSRAMSAPKEKEEERIPYDRNKITRFLTPSSILLAQADGHYTKLHNGEEELFCPWPISRLEKKLSPDMFVRMHRSFIVNHQKITGFRRDGDKVFCVIGEDATLEAPVSRSKLEILRNIMKLDQKSTP